jgi:solute carrier family 25 folate transporter 32
MRAEGIKSFYRGFVPSLFMSTYGVIQMYSYESLTHLFGYKSGNAKKMTWDNMLVPFVIGGTSRSLASVTLMPINVVRMRLQMKNYSVDEVQQKNLNRTSNYKEKIEYSGMRDTIRKIYSHEGIPGFYKGITPSVLKIFPTSGIFFLSYEFAMSRLMRE